MPRELNENEKQFEKSRLIKCGKHLLFRFGIRRVSVDDIVKEAGIAKGSFYNYFHSKDEFIYEMIWQLHEEMFSDFKQQFSQIGKLEKGQQRNEIKKAFFAIYKAPTFDFLILEHSEIRNFLSRYSKEELAKIETLEEEKYKELFKLLNIQDKQIAIVQNYIHIIIFGISHTDLLDENYLDKTVEALFDGLLNYLEV
jgi:Transcriptional regulator